MSCCCQGDTMRVLYLLFIVFLVYIDCKDLPHVERTVLKSGFHRDLQTTLRIPESLLAKVESVGCSILFTENIPSGAYVDPYQLNSLKSYGGPDAVVIDEVDVEKPEYESERITVLIFSNLSLVDTTWISGYSLPVHLRYHSVSQDTLTVVTFNKPEIAVRCVNHQLGMVHYGYGGESEGMRDIICDSNSKLLCDWTVIQYHIDTDDVSVDIPVGQSGHYTWVTAGTVLTTLFGCIVLTMKTLYTDIKEKES